MAWIAEDDTTAATPITGRWQEETAPTWWDTAKTVGQTADDAVRAAANAVTFGMADRLAGYMGGQGTTAEVAKSQAARERSPYASIAGDVAGAAALPGFGAEALAARYGSGLGARALGYGLTGTATGAAQGAGNTYTGNVPDYVNNALIGGALGGTLGAAGGAVFGARPQVSRATTPTVGEQHDISQASYNALAKSPAAYEPQALHNLANDLEQRLLAERYHWRDSPATWRALEEMRGGGAPGQLNTGPSAIIDPASIDFVRKGLNKIPKTEATATDRASADVVRRALDDFIANPPRGAVLPGTEREAALAADRAREASRGWGAFRRTEIIDDLIDNARTKAGSQHSGLNLQNIIRQDVKALTKRKAGESPASKAGFNEDEISKMTDFSRGGAGDNFMRYVDRALGGGGGLGAMAAGGFSGQFADRYFGGDRDVGTAIGLGAPAAGMVLRAIGNRRALSNINQLQNTIAQRSPAYEYRTIFAGTQPGPGSAPRAAKATRDAIALEILKQQEQLPRVVIPTYDGQVQPER